MAFKEALNCILWYADAIRPEPFICNVTGPISITEPVGLTFTVAFAVIESISGSISNSLLVS